VRVITLAAAWIVLIAAPAAAEPPNRPWAEGISEEVQAEAKRLFDAGNLLFEQEKYAQALAIYRDAVKKWDHPAIRYNMGVANIHLDQPLAAYEDLVSALRYGTAPLQADAYAQAQTYQKLLLGQLAQLKVVCAEPDVQVFLDGELVFAGPGDRLRVLLPGKHQLVASKPGFITATRAVGLVAGGAVEEVLRLVAMPQPIRTERRWANWTPWAVAGGGAALALLGVPFQLSARSNMNEYAKEVGEACPTGCPRSSIPASTLELESRAHLQNGLAIGLFATGGAVLVGGLTMVLLNQPRPVDSGSLAIAPTTSGGNVGVVVIGSF
jgi:tetratricopeptide (TPR) repeat protein